MLKRFLNLSGKLIPRRPVKFKNSTEWCRSHFQMVSSDSLPYVVKQNLKKFGENSSRINISEITDQKRQIITYCIQLNNQTREELLNSSYVKTVALPNMVHPDPKEQTLGIVIYVKNNITYQNEVPLGELSVYRPHKYLQLSNVNFFYRFSNSYNTFVGRGSYRLCGTKFDVEILRTKNDNVRIHGQSSDPVDVDNIEMTFGMEQAGERMLKVLKTYGVFSLRIMKPKVEMYLSRTISAKFSGHSHVEKVKTIAKTEILVGKMYQKYLLTTGMIFNDIPLGKFVSSFSGVYLRYLDLFHGKSGINKVKYRQQNSSISYR